MTADIVVMGIGNSFRRDDGVGPAVAAAVNARAIPDVSVLIDAGDPAVVLDAWAGIRLAVLIDAAVGGRSAQPAAARSSRQWHARELVIGGMQESFDRFDAEGE